MARTKRNRRPVVEPVEETQNPDVTSSEPEQITVDEQENEQPNTDSNTHTNNQSNDHSINQAADLNLFKTYKIWFAPNINHSIIDQFVLHGGVVSDLNVDELIDQPHDIDMIISDVNDDDTNQIRSRSLALYIVRSQWIVDSLIKSEAQSINQPDMFLPPSNQSLSATALVMSYRGTLNEAFEKRINRDQHDAKNKKRKRNGLKPIEFNGEKDQVQNSEPAQDQPNEQSNELSNDQSNDQPNEQSNEQSNDQSNDQSNNQPVEDTTEPSKKKSKTSKSKKESKKKSKDIDVAQSNRKSQTHSALDELIADQDDDRSNTIQAPSPILQPESRPRRHAQQVSHEQSLIQAQLLARRSLPARDLRDKLPLPQPDAIKTPQVRASIRKPAATQANQTNQVDQTDSVDQSVIQPSPARPRPSLKPHPSARKSRKLNSELIISSSTPIDPLDTINPGLASRVRGVLERRQAEREEAATTAKKQTTNQSRNQSSNQSINQLVNQSNAQIPSVPIQRRRDIDEWEPDPALLARLLAMRSNKQSNNQPTKHVLKTRRALTDQLSASQEEPLSSSQSNDLKSENDVDPEIDRAIKRAGANDPFAWSPSRVVRQRLSAHMRSPDR